MRYPGFVPTINLRLPVLSLTLFDHCYPSQTLLWLKIYQKLLSTHMHNWLLLYICRKNTYQSAVIRSISQCLAPKFASLSQPQKLEETNHHCVSGRNRNDFIDWKTAGVHDYEKFDVKSSEYLSNVDVSISLFNCTDQSFQLHEGEIDRLYGNIIKSLNMADNNSIPRRKSGTRQQTAG